MSKLAVVYLSTTGNTKLMADAIADGARSRNVDVEIKSLYDWKPEEAAAADAIAIGSPTFNYTMLPPIEKFVDELVGAGADGKDGAAFGSYGWSGEAPTMIAEKMRNGGMNILDHVLRVQYKPNEKDLKECNRLGRVWHKRSKNEGIYYFPERFITIESLHEPSGHPRA